MKELLEATTSTKYRRNSTFPSAKDTKVNIKYKSLFLIDLLRSQDADIDPESLLLPLSRTRKSRRVSTVDGLRPGGGGEGGLGRGRGRGGGGDGDGGGGVLLSENISMISDCRGGQQSVRKEELALAWR